MLPSDRAERTSLLLPPLRAELQIISDGEGPSAVGRSRNILFDPLRNRYVHIDGATAELISLWPRCRTASDLSAAAAAAFGTNIGERQIKALCDFLVASELVMPTLEQDWRRLAIAERQRQQGWLAWAIHNYLFVRIPLIAPEPFLAALAPRVAGLYTRAAAVVLGLIGFTGLCLVLRQWDRFLATFAHLFSLEGALTMALAVAIVKSLHELGHAITAVRYGCRVPSMGVCLMVLVPMLYTDVTDAWRLSSRRKRFAIGAAGIVVEAAIAAIALLAWAFLPEGAAKSIAFALATTSLLLSLGLNLNPFMRFDGYFLLCDASGIDNLQPRAFALGRWQLRELLFGLGAPPPELLPAATMRWLVAYAWCTWVYRLVVFTGIALLVYHTTFKLLGVVLFLIEIVFFIGLPVWREIKDWVAMRSRIAESPRSLVTLASAALLLIAVLVPWSGTVRAPAVLEDADLQQLYPLRAARLAAVRVQRGDRVATGTVIAELSAPDLDHEISLAKAKLSVVEMRLKRLAGDAQDRSAALVLQDSHRSLSARLSGLITELSELNIVAQGPGIVAEIDPNLHPGRWLRRTDMVAVIRGGRHAIVRGYVAEEDVGRIEVAAAARFVPEEPWALPFAAPWGQVREIGIANISAVGTGALAIPELSSHYGGQVAAKANGGREERTQTAVAGQFLITGLDRQTAQRREESVTNYGVTPVDRVVRGTLIAQGRSESFASRMMRQLLKVLVRESGF